MLNLDQLVDELSFEELEELNKLIAKAKLAKKPRIVVDFAVKSHFQDGYVYVHERNIKALERAIKVFRKKLGIQYLGYRFRQFDGEQWEVIEEKGDTSKFRSIEVLSKRLR